MDTFLFGLFTDVWAFVLILLSGAMVVASIALIATYLERRQRRLESLRYGTECERDLRLHDYEVDQLNYSTAGFWLGVGFAGLAVLGFVMALLWLDIHTPLLDQSVTLVLVLGAVVCGSISSIFLLQAANTRKLFEVLHRDRKISEAIHLVNSLTDPHVRARAQVTLAMQLSGVGALDVAAMQVLMRKAAERQQQAGRQTSNRVYRVWGGQQPRGLARSVMQ